MKSIGTRTDSGSRKRIRTLYENVLNLSDLHYNLFQCQYFCRKENKVIKVICLRENKVAGQQSVDHSLFLEIQLQPLSQTGKFENCRVG